MAAVATTTWLFVLSHVLQGLAVCCTTVVLFSCVRDRLDGDDAASAFSFLKSTLNIVPALAPMAGGLLAVSFGWRATFWALASYSLFVWALVAVGLAETRPAGTKMSTHMPFVRYEQIADQRRFIVFVLVNTGAMTMALAYVSLSSQLLMGEGRLSPLGFSTVFGANGFWIMLASIIANQVIRKMGRPTCLTLGTVVTVLMALGSLMLVLRVTTAPTS